MFRKLRLAIGRKQRPAGKRRFVLQHHLSYEPLEERAMLAVDLFTNNGTLPLQPFGVFIRATKDIVVDPISLTTAAAYNQTYDYIPRLGTSYYDSKIDSSSMKPWTRAGASMTPPRRTRETR